MQPTRTLTHLVRPLFVGALLLLGVQAHAESSTEDLLQRMASTMRTANYEGLLLHVQGEETRTMRIFHLYDEEHGERERLHSLDGPAREVVHEGDRCRCIWPRAKVVVHGRTPAWRGQLSPGRFADTERLADFYEFSRADSDRVAGLSCEVVKLTPRDGFRHGYRLCIHESSGMLLRLEVMEGERRLEMNQFASLRLEPVMDEAVLRPVTNLEGFREVGEQPDPSEPYQARWVATALPPGYSLILVAERIHARNGHPLEHQVYSDGLNSVSVFIEAGQEKNKTSRSLRGAMHRVVLESEGYRLTAIGEAPVLAMQLILDGLRPVETAPVAKP